MALLQQERAKIEAAGLEPNYRDMLLRNCDRNIAFVQEYIAKVGPSLELKEANNNVRQEISRGQQEKLDRQQKIHDLVDDFNRLMDQDRFPEAEVVAKRAAGIGPAGPARRADQSLCETCQVGTRRQDE